MIIQPLVQRETGMLIGYTAAQDGKMLAFGKTHSAAVSNGFKVILTDVLRPRFAGVIDQYSTPASANPVRKLIVKHL